MALRSLNEGRSVNPGYTPARCRACPARPSLNEGRSVNPGYTQDSPISASAYTSAQRRPERQPRLHQWAWIARCRLASALNEGRSVNPGYTWSGSRCVVRRRCRSTKAGASTPAAPALAGQLRHACLHRSTKAGASTPATLVRREDQRFVAHRSTKAGASTPATRVVHDDPDRRHRRSTKAGASTPATHPLVTDVYLGFSTLNEGRSVNPGYTVDFNFEMTRSPALNEGRSVNPGYTRLGEPASLV